jgi:hypothetical protein
MRTSNGKRPSLLKLDPRFSNRRTNLQSGSWTPKDFPQKKFSKRGMFLPAEKRGVFSPRFTINPPRFHHQKTTLCTPLFPKTLQKHPSTTPTFFSPVP